jgi:hypothetical protein
MDADDTVSVKASAIVKVVAVGLLLPLPLLLQLPALHHTSCTFQSERLIQLFTGATSRSHKLLPAVLQP